MSFVEVDEGWLETRWALFPDTLEVIDGKTTIDAVSCIDDLYAISPLTWNEEINSYEEFKQIFTLFDSKGRMDLDLVYYAPRQLRIPIADKEETDGDEEYQIKYLAEVASIYPNLPKGSEGWLKLVTND